MVHPQAQTVRVRFAPSPTGFLHVGGVRAALYNYLYAKSPSNPGGKFLLRIEDTDLERSEDRYTQDIQTSLAWLGLKWDEEPIFQSKRLGVYKETAMALVQAGHAYVCTCTEAEVEAMRTALQAAGKRPQYDRVCRNKNINLSEWGEKPYVIRAKIPLDGEVEFLDLIRGTIKVQNTEIDDFVLIRSNGAPTYNLSVVVDDVASQMTHIIRGDDHINNTPKQLHLYRFLNYPLPKFAHLPMILGADKKKLSKRHGAVSVNNYRAEGYLPESMLNFLARIGWSHGDQEVFTLDELKEFFSFEHVQKASGVFNVEKLLWVNGEHLKKADPARIQKIVLEDFATAEQKSSFQTPLALQLIALIQPKVKLVKEIADQLAPLVVHGVLPLEGLLDQAKALKWNKDPTLKEKTLNAIRALGTELQFITGFSSHSEVEALIRKVGDAHGVKLGDLVQPLRLTVSGRLVGASLFDLMALLPYLQVQARVKQALELG